MHFSVILFFNKKLPVQNKLTLIIFRGRENYRQFVIFSSEWIHIKSLLNSVRQVVRTQCWLCKWRLSIYQVFFTEHNQLLGFFKVNESLNIHFYKGSHHFSFLGTHTINSVKTQKSIVWIKENSLLEPFTLVINFNSNKHSTKPVSNNKSLYFFEAWILEGEKQ